MKNENLLPLTPVLILNNNFERRTELFIDHTGLLIYEPGKRNVVWTDCVYKHLYLTSLREIKEGEYYVRYNLRNEATGVHKYIVGTSVPNDLDEKIELTTDPILLGDGIPEIPFSFLEEYMKRYNAKSVIEISTELHPRPITLSGGDDLGEEGKDWKWSVEPYNAEPKIYFDKP